MSRHLRDIPSSDQQKHLNEYNHIVNKQKQIEGPTEEVDLNTFVEDLVIQDIIRESSHGMDSKFVREYILNEPDLLKRSSDTRKARLNSKGKLPWSTAFNIWFNQLVTSPRIFSRWFKYLPFPNDLFRSFNLLFELILKMKVDITLHPDYIEIFPSPELRIPLSILEDNEVRVINKLRTQHSDLFAIHRRIISGNKTIYTKFKPEVVIYRKVLLQKICAHFLSCSISQGQVLPVFEILSNALRKLELFDIHQQLFEVKMPGVNVFKKLPEYYDCDGCHGYRQDAIGPFNGISWAFANEIDQFAIQAEEFEQLNNLSFEHRVYGWCYLLNAYAQGLVTFADKKIKRVADKFMLGYESSVRPPRRQLGYTWEDLGVDIEVVLQTYPVGPNPFVVFTGFNYEPEEGVKLSYHEPLKIYPQGHYGGYWSVYITERDRQWQRSKIIERVIAEKPKSGPYVPLAPCLWFLLHQGDLELLTRIIQSWMPFGSKIRKRVTNNPVPKRCIIRKNWLSLVCVGEIIRSEQESLELMWLLIHNFVMVYEKPPLIEGKIMDDDLDQFWAESLSHLPAGVSDLFSIETNNKKLTSPTDIFRSIKWPNTGRELINQSKVESGEIANELWHAFYVAEAIMNGLDGKGNKYPQPFSDTSEIEVMWKGSVVKLDNLITVASRPIDQRSAPTVKRHQVKVCHCPVVPKITYQQKQEQKRIEEQREQARRDRERQASYATDMMAQNRIMSEFQASIL